ncbi:ras-GEF domain-containing family member 1B-A isoform X2 [Lates japonicus]|uniref:Ras-GEF domain-containing family member 1B-A isoform X2 n=1 Tax=Lates japonicus TaxID=270547 RepID=A0AAD3MTY4_LATJO|nr:ras-GEF domain-containing family member 1B-A isoform X2 [Lates japonicus]
MKLCGQVHFIPPGIPVSVPGSSALHRPLRLRDSAGSHRQHIVKEGMVSTDQRQCSARVGGGDEGGEERILSASCPLSFSPESGEITQLVTLFHSFDGFLLPSCSVPHQMDPSSNFYNYRTALRGATQRSITANSSREKIVIPFFSLLIKDIYFLNEGCVNRLQNGHINFEKFWELAKQVSEFMTWKKVECPFEKDRKILQYLLTAPVFTEDALYLASYESEGPENNMEKDRWKSLRSTLLSRV